MPWKKLAFTLGAIGAVGLVAFAAYVAPILRGGSGYAAKNICSGHFISGMSGQVVVDQALIGASPLLGYTSFEIDQATRQVKTRLFGLFPRIATFSEAIGCTLLPSGDTSAEHAIQPSVLAVPNRALPWPEGSAAAEPKPSLEDIVGVAFAETDPARLRHTKAVVVVHNGELVAERYADGIRSDTPLLGWSMTKSVTNMLVGLLVQDGKLEISEPAPVPAWHVEDGDLRATITTDNLLRMSSGLRFDETYGPGSDVTRMLSDEADMAAFAAASPLASAVGSEWAYSSGTSNILAGIVKRLVGGSPQQVYDFAQQRLFHPLGVRTAIMEQDASGTPIGSSYMYASARDWARLGQFCLQQGRWAGQQMLPEGWMAYSTQAAPANPDNTYGAQFWLNLAPDDTSAEPIWPSLPSDAFSMDGYQGQNVVMIPSRSLVVVRLGFTASGNSDVEELVRRLLDALPTETEQVDAALPRRRY